MTWTVTKENGAVAFSSWLAQQAADVGAERNALLQAFRTHPPLSLKPPPRHEPDPFLTALPRFAPRRGRPRPQAQHASEALHRRIGGFAHDYNNLLAVIIGNLELVEAAVTGDTRAEDRAAEAMAAARRAAHLTSQLMALARGRPVPADAAECVAEAAPAPAADRHKAEAITVLVVDNDAAVRAAATRHLHGFGCRVLEAGDAVAALKLLQDDDTIDVLFTEIVLPGIMNGFDLSQAAGLIRPDLKIIHASGHPEGSDVYQDEPRLSQDLIAKPYQRKHLRRILDDTLAGKRR